MSDLLYVLKAYNAGYTVYLQNRSWLITSNDKSSMDLLRNTLVHHKQKHGGVWLSRGVFYRKHPHEHNKDSLHITDSFIHPDRMHQTHENVLDLVALDLDRPTDVEYIRCMYQFANTSLFMLNDYEYNAHDSHLRIEGLAIALPETTVPLTPPLLDRTNDETPEMDRVDSYPAYKAFLNSLYFL